MARSAYALLERSRHIAAGVRSRCVRIITIKEARMLEGHTTCPQRSTHSMSRRARSWAGPVASIGTWCTALSSTIAGVKTRCGRQSTPQRMWSGSRASWNSEYHGLAGFRFYEAPEGSGADGSWDEGGRWRDQPLERRGGVLYSGGWGRGSRQMLWRGLRIVGGARGRIFMSSPLCLVRTCQPTAHGAPCASLMTIHDDCEEECPRLCNHRPCMTS